MPNPRPKKIVLMLIDGESRFCWIKWRTDARDSPHFSNLVKQIGVEKTQWKEFNYVVKES